MIFAIKTIAIIYESLLKLHWSYFLFFILKHNIIHSKMILTMEAIVSVYTY